jgi:hypothetical protein
LACSQRRERKGRRREQGGFSAACGGSRRARGRRKEGGKGEADRWDPSVGAAVKKKKRRGERWAGAGSWAGPPGPKGSGAGFCFFFFSFFSNFIFKSFFNSNSNQTFSNFSQEFYRLLETTQATKKPCKTNDDAHTLVVSKFIKLSLLFLELNLISNLISLNP